MPNIIIVGASSGIGSQIAIEYAKDPTNKIVLAARRHKLLNIIKLKAMLGECIPTDKELKVPQNIHTKETDITKDDQCKELIEFSLKKLYHIDQLIITVGIGMNVCYHKICSLSTLSTIMNTNYYSIVQLLFHARDLLKCTKVAIFSDAIIFQECYLNKNSIYIASKMALEGFVSSIRKECSKYRIHLVYPSAVCTNFYKKLLTKNGTPIENVSEDSEYSDITYSQSTHLMSVENAACAFIEQFNNKCTSERIFLDDYNRLAHHYFPFSKTIANFLSYIPFACHFHHGGFAHYYPPQICEHIYQTAHEYKCKMENDASDAVKHKAQVKIGQMIECLQNNKNKICTVSQFNRLMNTQSIGAIIRKKECKMCLPGDNVLIVGASYGLGKALAIEYGKKKANIVVSARQVELLELTASDMREKGAQQATVIPADITKIDDIKFLLSQSLKEFDCKYFNTVIFNLGQGMQACFSEIESLDLFEPVTNINFNSLLLFVKYLIPLLRKQEIRAKL